jgi:hypothetical protein
MLYITKKKRVKTQIKPGDIAELTCERRPPPKGCIGKDSLLHFVTITRDGVLLENGQGNTKLYGGICRDDKFRFGQVVSTLGDGAGLDSKFEEQERSADFPFGGRFIFIK